MRYRHAVSEGSSALSANDYAKAETAYSKALAIEPSSREAESGLLDAMDGAGDYDGICKEAKGQFSGFAKEDAQQLTEKAAGLLYAAADSALSSQEYDKAASLYNDVITVAGSGSSYGKKAAGKITDIDLNQAESSGSSQQIAAWEKVLKDDPTNIKAYNELASLYTADGDYDKAAQVLEQLLSRYPDNTAILSQIADVYADAGDYDKALDALDKAAKISNTDDIKAARLRISVQKAQKAEGMEAVSLWQDILADNPTYVDGYASLANLYVSLNDYSDALTTLKDGYKKTKDSLLKEQYSLTKKNMESAGISTDKKSQSENPVEELQSALADNDYAKAVQAMADSRFLSLIDKKEKAAENDAQSNATSSEAAKKKASSGTSSGSGSTQKDYTASVSSDGKVTVSKVTVKTSDLGASSADTETKTSVKLGHDKKFDTDTLVVYAADGTEIIAYRPAYTDELNRTVIGEYGRDRNGYGSYVLTGGKVLSSAAYYASFSP